MENLRSEIYKEINPEFGAGPDVSVSAIGNIYTRMMRFNSKGTKELGHSHTFDHMTILASGKLKVTVDEKETEFKAPAMIYIKAGKVHELEAMEDRTLSFCVSEFDIFTTSALSGLANTTASFLFSAIVIKLST